MARVKVIATGSSGNAYVLTSGSGETLLLECGVSYDDILQALDYSLANVVGLAVSHHHKDHFNPKTADRLRKAGIPVYGTGALAERYPFVKAIPPRGAAVVGGFDLTAFAVPHGSCECNAYEVDFPEGEGKLVFATDCEDFPYNVPDVNFMLIEANYDENLVRHDLYAGEEFYNASENHMEIDTTMAVIKRHLSPSFVKAILVHMSKGLSDERAFVRRVEGLCVDCEAARGGGEYELDIIPF